MNWPKISCCLAPIGDRLPAGLKGLTKAMTGGLPGPPAPAPPVGDGRRPLAAPSCVRPLIPLVLTLMAGIAAGAWWPGGAGWSVLGLVPCAAAILWHLRWGRSGLAAPLLFFFLLGYLSIQPYLAPRFGPHHVARRAGQTFWTITGRVGQAPVMVNHRQKLVLRAETLESGHGPAALSGNIRLTVIGDEPALKAGDKIIFEGRLKTISNFNNPGGFDYRRHMAFQDVWVSAYVKADRLRIVERRPGQGLGAGLAACRRAIQTLIAEKTVGRPETQAVLEALVIGRTEGISGHLRQAFNRCGVGHLLAISGLHVGIVAAAAFYLLSRALGLFKALLWLAWARRGAAILAILPVVFYGLLAGMSPSTQRAVIMVTACLAAFLMGRQNNLINTVALAALAILIVEPPALFSISFQLSFAAVLAIIWGTGRFAAARPAAEAAWWQRLALRAGQFALISLWATLGTLPLVAFYFNRVSLVGLVANPVLIPLLGFGAVTLGLLAVFCYPLSVALAGGLLSAGAFMVDQGLKIIHWLADFSLAAVTIVTPTVFEIVLFYGGLAVLFHLRRRPVRRVMVILLLCAVSADLSFWIHQRFFCDALRVTALDVGQGSAAVLELPHGFTMLVDGGGFADNQSFDVGERIVAPFLWRRKIRSVDLLVLTHPNSDHLNGLLYIARHFHVKSLWSNGQAVDTAGYRQLLDILEENQIPHPPYATLLTTHRIHGVSLEILHPPADFLERAENQSQAAVNDNSLVLKVNYGNIGMLFTGDLEAGAEKTLCSTYPDARLRCDVLFAPHHGSRSSSTLPFIEKVRPRIVVISAGAHSRFGFPHQKVLERYQRLGARIYRTDQAGAIRLTSDGAGLRVSSYRPAGP